MKTSIMTTGAVDLLGIDEGFAAIKAAGFEAVDFNLDIFFVQKDNMDDEYFAQMMDEARVSDYIGSIKAASEKYGVAIGQCHAPFPSYIPRKPKDTEIMRAFIRKSIELCAEVGCSHIVIHPCADGSARYPSITKAEEHQINMDYYTSLIPLLKQYNVVCCLENMWCWDWGTKKAYISSCSDMNEACRYIDELNAIAGEKRFAFCLDIGHLLMLGIDPCNALTALGYRVEALHIHDNDGWGDDHTAPYLGVCNWDRFIKGLRSIGYQGNISFETAPINRAYPKELIPAVLKLLGATAEYFRVRVLAEKK